MAPAILDGETSENVNVNVPSYLSLQTDDGYKIRETLMGTKRKIKVIFVGMGASGIDFAYQVKNNPDIELAIYEKNPDIGGTWYENRYPGCACDIPSVAYQFSWQRKPDWSKYYSGSKEIWSYFKDLTVTNDLEKYVKFNHRVVKAEWLDEQGQWEVTVENEKGELSVDRGEFFLNGGGFLNAWKWPIIKGLESFQGPRLHSANWDDNVDLSSKRILVVGAGSSGVQIVPTIIDKVQEIHVIARSPTWITAGFAQKYAGAGGQNFEYSAETLRKFKEDPKFYLKYCKAIESELNLRFRLVVNESQEALDARKFSIAEMSRKLAGKPELIEKLMPKDFGIGCRRPTPGNGFLEALAHEKTTVYTKEIPEVTPTGFISADGQYHEVDIIICATGFDTRFRPQWPIIANGRNLQDDFNSPKGDVLGYLGMSQPEVPNYFTFSGPYGPLGHGSALPVIETYTKYILQVIEKFQVEDIKKLQVKRSVADAFSKHSDLYMKRTAWSGPCSSWFKAGEKGRKPILWPGSRIHYISILQKPRFEDFDIEYLSGNEWNFLGNGFDVREYDGRDLTWYYGKLDDQDKQPYPEDFPPPLY
jgi:cation diffusion facilitator CzcD-associated flavoprotein CzcO